MMQYRPLGNTGLSVSEIGLGCEGLGEEQGAMAQKLIAYAEKKGINYIDLYTSDPQVRTALGDALVGRREKFILQGHIGSTWQDGQYQRSRELPEVEAAFEDMLTRLQTTWVDVGMIHYCDAMSDWQTILDNGILEYAKALKAAGRIHHIGLSSHNPVVAQAAIETGDIEVLMFSINPSYDLQPPSENVEDLWAEETYEKEYLNMDPDRERLYESCQARGVGISVMKAYGGGDLLQAELSPAGVALTVNQCLGYALSRPGVATVVCGAHSPMELGDAAAYEEASEEERDYAAALASFPRTSWQGHCMYCSHCAPCRAQIDIASVNKFLNLALAAGATVAEAEKIPETVREHYKLLDHHGSECVGCGQCEPRCPFGVSIRVQMGHAAALFGM